MNSRAITAALVTISGLIIAMIIIMQVLGGNWNAIGQLFKYLTIGSAIAAFVAPKFGFWLLLLTTGYLDLLKRMLIFAGSTNMLDVTLVLAMSPLIAAGMFMGVVLKDGLSGELLTPRNSRILMLVLFLGGLLGVTGFYASGGGLGGVRSAANFSAYTTLLYVIPKLFRSEEEVWKLLKIVVILFVPVALYAYVQMFRGFTWWEIAYLETGLSGEKRILGGQDFRTFSTLNSSQNLSKVMSMVLVFAALIPWFGNRNAGSKIFSVVLVFLFGGAAYASGSRTGLAMALIALFTFWLFQYRGLTIFTYVSGVVAILIIIMTAESMLKNKTLNNMTGALIGMMGAAGNDEMRKRLNLATLSARLESLNNLKDPTFWTPLGFKFEKRTVQGEGRRTHDILSKLLAQMGYIPLSILAIVVFMGLRKIHGHLWRTRESVRLKRVAFSVVACVVLGGLSATENLSTFPVNTFLYLSGGILVLLMAGYIKSPDADDKKTKAAEPTGRPGFRGGRPVPA